MDKELKEAAEQFLDGLITHDEFLSKVVHRVVKMFDDAVHARTDATNATVLELARRLAQ